MAKQNKSRKFIATSATAALVASALVPAAAFASDLKDYDQIPAWAKDAVDYLTSGDKKVLDGDLNGNFNAWNNLTRGEAAKILAVSLGLTINEDAKADFDDTKTHWSSKFIAALQAKNENIISGYNGKFRPNDNITREEFAKMIATAYGLKLDEAAIVNFNDVSGWGAEFAKILASLGVAEGKKEGKFEPKANVTRAEAAVFVHRAEVPEVRKAVETAEAKVVSVSAINAKQIEVKFNQVLDSSIIDGSGTIVDGAFTLTKISGAGLGTISNTSAAKLSADKKSVIIDASAKLEGEYVVTLASGIVKAANGKTVSAYTSSVFSVNDKVSPAVDSITNLNAGTVRVKFTEPLSSQGSWSFKFADGSTATVTPAFTPGNDYVDLTIDPAIANGSQISATILGAADYAGNLVSPNPTSISFTKGSKDGVKPTVSSITSLGLNKFEVKFSEKVQNVDITDFTVNGTDLTASTGSVSVDAADDTKYVVTLTTAFTPEAPATSVLATVAVKANATSLITDLSGETFDGVSRIVEFKKDTVAPKLVKSEVKKENGEEYLYLTFDETVTPGDLDALVAKEYKDYVTTTSTVDLDGTADDKLVAVAGDSKSLKVKLSDITFNGGALTQGAEYTVSLANFTDASNNALATTNIKFVRGSDADTSKPVPVATIVDNDTIRVTFDRALDGASAVNKSNYSINGLTIDTVTLLPGNIVELKLVSGTNTLSGNRNISVANVKSKDGVVMDNYLATLNLTENVKPQVTKVEFIDLSTIKVTFSETVKSTTVADATADFALKLDGATYANTLTEDMAADGNTMTIKLGTPVSPTDYAKTFTLVPADTFTVADLQGNLAADFAAITISK
ncbi:S-layer homology domain-containing protein [Ureibacillus sp. MALMAid1270]|uniref:S-layer homology domain-containing protein n=1 Tax=Ureibacillus sp. MALMAid1270 TaxID=3411629 RepID=UPI003BA6ADFF